MWWKTYMSVGLYLYKAKTRRFTDMSGFYYPSDRKNLREGAQSLLMKVLSFPVISGVPENPTGMRYRFY